MSEQQTIPEPILDALRKAAILDVAAKVHEGVEDGIQKRIDELETLLKAAREQLGKVGQKRQAAVDDAEHYRDMAYGRAHRLGAPLALMQAADKAAQEAAAAPQIPAPLQPPAEPQITAEDPLNLAQLDHTTAHPIPAQTSETPR